jgi:hypothetical protein
LGLFRCRRFLYSNVGYCFLDWKFHNHFHDFKARILSDCCSLTDGQFS